MELDDSDLPPSDVVRVNWDGEVIDENWFKQEAFTIGNKVITKEEVAAVSGVTVTIIVIIVLICMAISYRKRKRIVV